MTAAALKLSSDFHDIACSGAEISDLTEPWTQKDQAAQVTQLATDSPTLATVTIGGNSMIQGATQNTDWGFADILTNCYEQGVLNQDPDGCSSDGTLAKADAAVTSTDPTTGLQARLTAAYEAIKAGSPSTKVLVVGYPDIFPPVWSANTALHCAWLGPDDITGLNQIATDLNATVQASAAAAGVPFVSTLNVMAGHTLCTAKSDIESITFDSGVLASSAGHPLPPGQRAMAKVVEPALNELYHSTAFFPLVNASTSNTSSCDLELNEGFNLSFDPIEQCHPAVGGVAADVFLQSGQTMTFDFTVPTGCVGNIIYGIPPGGFVNNVSESVQFDSDAPFLGNGEDSAFYVIAPTTEQLWISPPLIAGDHDVQVTSPGESVNVYGLWAPSCIETSS
jgi:lysophospholipase L1-like esterase